MSATSSQRDPRRLVKTKTPGIYTKGGRYVVVFRDPTGRQRKRSAAHARGGAHVEGGAHRGREAERVRRGVARLVPRLRAPVDRDVRRPHRSRHPAGDAARLPACSSASTSNGEPTGTGAVDYFGRTPLAAIRPQDVKGYAAKVAATGKARNTVRLAVAPVKALLATAHEEGLIRSNPAAGLRLGRTVAASPVKETHALTEEQVVAVLAEVPERHRLLVEFLAQTGLRISEALALTKADVDFGRRRVSVSRRLYEGRLDAPKSRHGIRQVPLSPGLARKLWTLLATVPDEAVVFAADRSKLYAAVRAAGERAGIEWPVGLHTFRHSCASIMFRRGVSKEAIRRMLGHHSWDFTAGTYVHLDDDDLPDGAVMGDLTAGAIASIGETGLRAANEGR